MVFNTSLGQAFVTCIRTGKNIISIYTQPHSDTHTDTYTQSLLGSTKS